MLSLSKRPKHLPGQRYVNSCACWWLELWEQKWEDTPSALQNLFKDKELAGSYSIVFPLQAGAVKGESQAEPAPLRLGGGSFKQLEIVRSCLQDALMVQIAPGQLHSQNFHKNFEQVA